MPPPPRGGKRKRDDRSYSDDQQYSRPSPHRPSNLDLAYAHQGPAYSPGHDRNHTPTRGRGSWRFSRGGRGGVASSPVHSSVDDTPPPPLRRAQPDSPEPPQSNGAGDVTKMAFADPPKPAHPHHYTYISTAVCDSWQTGGKEAVLGQALDASQAQDGADLVLQVLLQELVQSVVFGRLDPRDAGELAREVLDSEMSDQGGDSADLAPTVSQAAILDSISVMFEADAKMPLDRLSAFLIAAGVSQELLRLELDSVLLERLELIRNTFGRMNIRKQTNLLYRQANFNLMREESEGFAKLMTELFTTASNEPPTGQIAEATVEKVKAMIGAFDLDVGRSLDVVLDVFGAVLVKQFRFFVKFLRASPWWPRKSPLTRQPEALGPLPMWALPGFPQWHLSEQQKDMYAKEALLRDEAFWPQAREMGLGAFYLLGRTKLSQEQVEKASQSAGDELTKQWIVETGTMPPNGNRDAAQLLGFKLRFYSSSAARDESDVLPDNLIYLSALLIKIGFISLKDLYPHIWRTDEDMEELKQQKLKEKADRERASRPGAGARNALMMAGALADDTLPAAPRLKEPGTSASTPSKDAKDAEPEKVVAKESNEAPDQKVLLLKSLLAIGALPEALFVLGRFPWIMDVFPELPEYIHRILHHSLSKIYGAIRPLQHRTSLREHAPLYETDLPGLQKGQVKMVEPTERKILRWAQLDKTDSMDGTDYRFYWDEWSDNVPVCQTVDDVFTLCDSLLPLVGVKIGQDPSLILKLSRIGKSSLAVDPSEKNRARWLDLSKRVLLPALSLTKSNAGVVNEVFELLSRFPISARYLMYLEWSSGRTSRNPAIKAAFDQARAETKDILKRISKTNVRPMARALAKIAFANPHIVIATALAQIEVYDSIAEVFVEGARYFTDLGYDVLTWAMISSMARDGRNRVQEDGIFTSRWLTALAHFAGNIYKRYGMMKPGPILQYVVEQLESGNTTDLKMLEQLVVAMAGIATDTNYNDTQLQAMGGGPLLQAQTVLQLLDRRHDSKKTSDRLMKSLQDTGLTAKFLISMAQQRQSCIFDDSNAPLKAIGNTYDEVHRVMVQYLDLLRTNLSTEDFRATIPDVVNLLVDYELRPEIAFWISRPTLRQQIVESDQAATVEQSQNQGDVEMADNTNGNSSEDGEAVDNPAEDVPDNLDGDHTPIPLDAPSDTAWHPVLKDIMDSIQPNLPQEVDEVIGLGFYVTFWQLSLYDITIPGKAYEDELSRQHKKIAAISADRSDVSASGARKREIQKKELSELVERLLQENKQHLKAFGVNKLRLQREKDHWFVGKNRMDKLLNTALMEHCFLPRILSSSLDAYFCFKFVKYLHSAATPNFRTLGFYDLLFEPFRLTSLIFMCTSKEADNLGRFLNEVLKDLSRWHGQKSIYEKEAWGMKKNFPGFAMKVEAGKVVSLLDFDKFRNILFKWHKNLHTALQKCLSSPEYMHVRNAISVLRTISAVYPIVNHHGAALQKTVDKLHDSEKEDLKVSSQALLGALHRREKLWMDQIAFREGPEKAAQAAKIAQQKADAMKIENSVDVKPKAEEDTEIKDTVMSDANSKNEQKATDESNEDAKQLPAKPESASDAGGLSSRSANSNGASTPSRDNSEISSRRDTRPPRAETSKPLHLPRRVSPPPSRQGPPASLPSRPDSADVRNGHRDSPRQSNRPLPTDISRPPLDNRLPHPRESRAGFRGGPGDVPFDDYEYDRQPRRYDRPPEGLPPGGRDPSGRDERYPPRDQDRNTAYDRSRQERDRPPMRPPPGERELREPSSRSRGPLSGDLISSDAPGATGSNRNVPADASAVAINPERAALIGGTPDQRPSRQQQLERPSRPSRPTSPRREEDRRQYQRQDRDERPPPDRRNDYPPNRGGPPSTAPLGLGHRSGPGQQYNRDSRHPPSQPPIDMQHGRLEQEPSYRPPPSHAERLVENDVPSGPRSRTQPGGSRGRGTPTSLAIPASPSQPDRPTPTGPSGRHTRNNSYGDNTPTTPGANADPGIHPSRLNQIDPPATDAARPGPPVQSSGPPAGPRSGAPAGAPSGPGISPTSRSAASAPHTSEMGAGRGGRNNRNPLMAVNNTLAQAGSGPGGGRGRGGMRQNSASFGSHMAPPPPPPSGPQPPGHANRSNGYPPQQDLFASSNPNDVPVASRPPSSRHDISRDRRSEQSDDRPSERRTGRHLSLNRNDDIRGDRDSHRGDREPRDGKEDRHGGDPGLRRDDRPSRRGEEQQVDDERRSYGNRPFRDESRKHSRGDEGAPYGRGGSRVASENKRPRRGT